MDENKTGANISMYTVYCVPSFVFRHFLLNILIIIKTFVPKLRSSTRIKKVLYIFCFDAPFTESGFKPQPKLHICIIYRIICHRAQSGYDAPVIQLNVSIYNWIKYLFNYINLWKKLAILFMYCIVQLWISSRKRTHVWS